MLTAGMIRRYHHFVAMYAPDPVAALKQAEDEGLSARNMAELFKIRVYLRLFHARYGLTICV